MRKACLKNHQYLKKYLNFRAGIAVCTKKCGCQGRCLGNQMRARHVLDAFSKIGTGTTGLSGNLHVPVYTLSSGNRNTNWVHVYINLYGSIEGKQERMTNVYCLVSILLEHIEIGYGDGTLEIKEPLNTMLHTYFQPADFTRVLTKILYDQIDWSNEHISAGGNQVQFLMLDATGQPAVAPLAVVQNYWTTELQRRIPQNTSFYFTAIPQFLLLKLLLNSIVISDPKVKNLTLYQTANVETVIGPIQLNLQGVFEPVDASVISEEIDYNGTSAAEASGKLMDSLKGNKSAYNMPQRPVQLTLSQRKRLAAGKGKEIGDYGQQMTAFAGEATCLTGDLNAFNRPGLAKRVNVVCRNTSLTSREMTENVRERGDNCFQLFSRPHTTNPIFSVVAIQVLQVAPVPKADMDTAKASLTDLRSQMNSRILLLKSIVKRGNVDVQEKKGQGL